MPSSTGQTRSSRQSGNSAGDVKSRWGKCVCVCEGGGDKPLAIPLTCWALANDTLNYVQRWTNWRSERCCEGGWWLESTVSLYFMWVCTVQVPYCLQSARMTPIQGTNNVCYGTLSIIDSWVSQTIYLFMGQDSEKLHLAYVLKKIIPTK